MEVVRQEKFARVDNILVTISGTTIRFTTTYFACLPKEYSILSNIQCRGTTIPYCVLCFSTTEE